MKNMVKPISPSEIVGKKKTLFPDEVIEAFNELIAKDFLNGESRVNQEDAVDLIMQKMMANGKEVTRNQIFKMSWLDIEDIYRQEGWVVEYNKPVYYAGEDFEPHWIFTKGKNRG